MKVALVALGVLVQSCKLIIVLMCLYSTLALVFLVVGQEPTPHVVLTPCIHIRVAISAEVYYQTVHNPLVFRVVNSIAYRATILQVKLVLLEETIQLLSTLVAATPIQEMLLPRSAGLVMSHSTV